MDTEEVLRTRASWLRAMAVPTEDGGTDIVLRIDGTYFMRSDSRYVDHLVRYWNRTLGIS